MPATLTRIRSITYELGLLLGDAAEMVALILACKLTRHQQPTRMADGTTYCPRCRTTLSPDTPCG